MVRRTNRRPIEKARPQNGSPSHICPYSVGEAPVQLAVGPAPVTAPVDERPRFSIVVPCFNASDKFPATLTSLQNQTFTGRYEIIVVDNNCTDATPDIARQHGVRVVSEPHPGVCWARQRGTMESVGEIVVSADADTIYARDWLATIDRNFGTDEEVVAVVGPCRYVGGPPWGRVYARALFGGVWLWYRWTDRTLYVSATNIAFRKRHWTGYDVRLTQGGDELYLLRDLRRRGRVVYDHANPTFTSSRRLTRGPLYGFFVTLLVYYLLAYVLNRAFRRTVIGSAPAYRNDRSLLSRRIQTSGVALLCGALVLLPFLHRNAWMHNTWQTLVDYVSDTFGESGS